MAAGQLSIQFFHTADMSDTRANPRSNGAASFPLIQLFGEPGSIFQLRVSFAGPEAPPLLLDPPSIPFNISMRNCGRLQVFRVASQSCGCIDGAEPVMPGAVTPGPSSSPTPDAKRTGAATGAQVSASCACAAGRREVSAPAASSSGLLCELIPQERNRRVQLITAAVVGCAGGCLLLACTAALLLYRRSSQARAFAVHSFLIPQIELRPLVLHGSDAPAGSGDVEAGNAAVQDGGPSVSVARMPSWGVGGDDSAAVPLLKSFKDSSGPLFDYRGRRVVLRSMARTTADPVSVRTARGNAFSAANCCDEAVT